MKFLNGEIESIICDAINIIVDKKIKNANYDKVVSGIVVSENLEGQNKYSTTTASNNITVTTYQEVAYRIEYQNASFIAYPIVEDMEFNIGDRVLVLIPNNDMSNEKYILRKRPKEV